MENGAKARLPSEREPKHNPENEREEGPKHKDSRARAGGRAVARRKNAAKPERRMWCNGRQSINGRLIGAERRAERERERERANQLSAVTKKNKCSQSAFAAPQTRQTKIGLAAAICALAWATIELELRTN